MTGLLLRGKEMAEFEDWLHDHGWKRSEWDITVWKKGDSELTLPKTYKGKLIRYKHKTSIAVSFTLDQLTLTDAEARIMYSTEDLTQNVTIR